MANNYFTQSAPRARTKGNEVPSVGAVCPINMKNRKELLNKRLLRKFKHWDEAMFSSSAIILLLRYFKTILCDIKSFRYRGTDLFHR